MRWGQLDSVRSWAYPVLFAGLALLFDAADRRIPFGILRTGPLDEAAHLATAALGLLVLACFVDVPRRFYVAALIASVGIDLDHVPIYLGLLNGSQRPVTHSLATVAVFVLAAVASRRHRAVLAGVATGLVFHFARDIAEGSPGVRLLWPVDQTAWAASYWWFLGMIIAFTAARLVLVSTGVPRRRIHLFQAPAPSRPAPQNPAGQLGPSDPVPVPEVEGSDLEGGGTQRR
jgi:hypothetical protein